MAAITKEEANKPLNDGKSKTPVLFIEHRPQFTAIEAILKERQWQDKKHGVIEEHGHTVGEWILIAERELAEAKEALLKGGTGRDRPLHELVQVAATCVAALEQHGVDDLPSKWGDR